ncbi:MAG: four-carbon acid sugar kinase family protein [Verrucomicrobiota bacterium]
MEIAILADDFSGAAELAGIAAACGYVTEVQTRFDPQSTAEVIAVDTDTRLRSEHEAISTVERVTREIALKKPGWIFKKTDSVLRGHVRAEISAILSATGKSDCLLIPANPSKGRRIKDGQYSIDGIPLSETVLGKDPDFPVQTDRVKVLLGPSERIVLPNIDELEQIPRSIPATTLPAGAADFFTTLLGSKGSLVLRKETRSLLVICGSLAAWDSGRPAELENCGFSALTLEDPIPSRPWKSSSRIFLAIGRPHQIAIDALLPCLVERARSLIENETDLRIALEGGATATAFLRAMGWDRFFVVPENHEGVGTLIPLGAPDGILVSVKPGSYPWPDSLFL